jgi:hypothetical protein
MATEPADEPWTDQASLIGVRELPTHGTVASCIREWRLATEDQQAKAVLLTVAPIRVAPGDTESATFRGKAIEKLSAAMPKAMDVAAGPVFGGLGKAS